MNRKQISANIERKVDQWLETFPNGKELKPEIVVTGGCITSMLLNEKVNDYDVYLRDFGAVKKVAGYYVGKFKTDPPPEFQDTLTEELNVSTELCEQGTRLKIKVWMKEHKDFLFSQEFRDWLEKATYDRTPPDEDPFRPLFLTENAITLSDGVQITIRFYGDPEQIHATYDYVHCMNYWTVQTGLVLRPAALESTLTKQLKYQGSQYPLCSIFRARKFIQRGWSITAGELLKMILQAVQLKLNDLEVLEDQLVGVDTVIFQELCQKIRDSHEKLTLNDVIGMIEEVF